MTMQSRDPGSDFLARLAEIDWWALNMDAPADWDPALLSAALIVDTATLPMALLVGPEGRVVANEAALDAVGAGSFARMTGQRVRDMLPGSAVILDAVVAGVGAGKTYQFVDQPLRVGRGAASQVRLFDLDFVPVFGRGGTVVAALGIAHDVTQRIVERRQLIESEQRLRLALEGSGMVGIWTYEVGTRLCSCDANVADMFNLKSTDFEHGVDVSLFIRAMHPHDRARVTRELKHALDTGSAYRCRYRVEVKGSDVRWVVASGKPSYDEDGVLLRLLGVVVDISDQMETAAALKQSRFHFQALSETLPQIVWSSDAEGRHDYFSARWSEFTGIKPQEITEDTWKHLVHSDDQAMVAEVWGSAVRHGIPYDLDYRFRHHSGEYRWLRVMALPMRDEDGAITRWYGTSTDIHDARLLAQEREALAVELRRIATEDQLTEVFTRRAFIDRGENALAAAQNRGEPIALLMLDVDFFKSVNDTYGHPGGDKVLAAAAARIKSALRPDDFVGRLGGEEFAIFAPNCTAETAYKLAERIRCAVGATPITFDGERALTVTVSVGVTSVEYGRAALDQLLSVADRALYMAKQRGRNRSVSLMSGESSPDMSKPGRRGRSTRPPTSGDATGAATDQ